MARLIAKFAENQKKSTVLEQLKVGCELVSRDIFGCPNDESGEKNSKNRSITVPYVTTRRDATYDPFIVRLCTYCGLAYRTIGRGL